MESFKYSNNSWLHPCKSASSGVSGGGSPGFGFLLVLVLALDFDADEEDDALPLLSRADPRADAGGLTIGVVVAVVVGKGAAAAAKMSAWNLSSWIAFWMSDSIAGASVSLMTGVGAAGTAPNMFASCGCGFGMTGMRCAR